MINCSHLALLSNGVKFKNLLKEMANKDPKIISHLTNNFLKPVNNGYCPFNELQGKYKPSIDVKFNNIMSKAFMNKANTLILYHYHFGYIFYKEGNDKNYQGMISDGILHVKLTHNKKEKVVTHEVFWVHLTHDPFSLPLLNLP